MKEMAMARFDTRMPEKQKELFEQAATLSGYKSLAAFILHAAEVEAEKIMARHNAILASEKDREIFFEALMNPPQPNAALSKAAKEYKKTIAGK